MSAWWLLLVPVAFFAGAAWCFHAVKNIVCIRGLT